MPRLLNRPPKLRRHASGQAFVSVSGKSIYLGKWGSPEARAAYRKFKGDWKPAPLVAMVSDRDSATVTGYRLATSSYWISSLRMPKNARGVTGQ